MEWKGQYCSQAEPSTRVATTAAQWAALWSDIGREAPQADLGTHFAAAVFLGQRNTGGYGVRFMEPVAEGKTLKIRYETLTPKGFVTQAFTQPYAVRLFPKTDLQVLVRETGNP
ncbi:MAG: protease complex subunit PrcB family protein [Elusimicrobia bacterium]|nr:protease complex subunit PrcB family protein [Elusimicrobiota bacterium]